MNGGDAHKPEALYSQVCSQHDGISDFRAKLLALLPIASGAGILLLLEKDGTQQNLLPHSVFIGAFGIAVTTGLFFYELRGIQKCIALIGAAKELEQGLSNQFQGAFTCRPPSVWGVSAERAALIIYPAVIGSWAYIFTLGLPVRLWGDWINHHPSALVLIRATFAFGTAGLWAFVGREYSNVTQEHGTWKLFESSTGALFSRRNLETRRCWNLFLTTSFGSFVPAVKSKTGSRCSTRSRQLMRVEG